MKTTGVRFRHTSVLKSRKPQASRPRSPEIYLVGEGFKG
jgi:23S rRNA U2552 (ribose-2'-O)-methylase RlmE/FtsJ